MGLRMDLLYSASYVNGKTETIEIEFKRNFFTLSFIFLLPF